MRLKVEKNLELDVAKFTDFFFESKRRQLKEFMLRSYSSLREIKTKKQIKDFVNRLYKKFRTKIDSVTKELKDIIKKIDLKVFSEIESLLNEKFDQDIFVYPTMLPMSPYGKNYFNLSIMYNVLGNKPLDSEKILSGSIHELSHLLFIKKIKRLFKCKSLKEIADKKGISLRSLDGLKEIYAPIIQNHLKMKKYFPNKVVGNSEYSLIKIEYKGLLLTIEDFFIGKYRELEKKRLNRDQIDKEIFKILKKIDKEFSEKLTIYNTVNQKEFIKKGLYNPIKFK